MIETVLRILLPLYALLTIATLAAHRARMRRATGYDPVVIRPFRSRDTPHDFLVAVLFAAVLALLVDVLLYAISTRWLAAHLGIPALQNATPLRWVGIVAVTAGLYLSGRGSGTRVRAGAWAF